MKQHDPGDEIAEPIRGKGFDPNAVASYFNYRLKPRSKVCCKEEINVSLDTGRRVVKTQLSDACCAVNLKRSKQEMLDFIRHGLFVNPNFPRS